MIQTIIAIAMSNATMPQMRPAMAIPFPRDWFPGLLNREKETNAKTIATIERIGVMKKQHKLKTSPTIPVTIDVIAKPS
jgi:hypothetical protein